MGKKLGYLSIASFLKNEILTIKVVTHRHYAKVKKKNEIPENKAL